MLVYRTYGANLLPPEMVLELVFPRKVATVIILGTKGLEGTLISVLGVRIAMIMGRLARR